MRIIIPVAGRGERLKPLTDTTPKTLLEVAGKPVLGYILDWVGGMNISEVVLVVRPGRDAAQIKHYVRSYRASLGDFNVRYVEQPEPIGSGHAVWLALQDMKRSTDPVLIVNGDAIPYERGAELFQRRLSTKSPLDSLECSTVSIQRVPDPENHGVVEVDRRLWVSKMVEKPANPQSNLTMSGIFYIRRADYLFDALDVLRRFNVRLNGELSLTGGLKQMFHFGESFFTRRVHTFDCGSYEGLKKARRYFS